MKPKVRPKHAPARRFALWAERLAHTQWARRVELTYAYHRVPLLQGHPGRHA